MRTLVTDSCSFRTHPFFPIFSRWIIHSFKWIIIAFMIAIGSIIGFSHICFFSQIGHHNLHSPIQATMKFQLGNGHIKDEIKQIIKLWSHKEDKNKLLLLLLVYGFIGIWKMIISFKQWWNFKSHHNPNYFTQF